MRFFDASALVKRYLWEEDSSLIRSWLSATRANASRLSHLEVASAIARRHREGDLSPSERAAELARLDADFSGFLVNEITEEIIHAARALVTRHPLRAGDAIQLASCLHLANHLGTPVEFVAFDARLRTAAEAEGLRIPS